MRGAKRVARKEVFMALKIAAKLAAATLRTEVPETDANLP